MPEDQERQEEQRQDAHWEADAARKFITVTLTVNGEQLARNFRAHELSDIKWDPIINDMADTIAKSQEPI